MNRKHTAISPLKLLIAAGAAMGLAACAPDQPESYETDVVDQSGGELIVDDATPGVPLNLPETPMTNVPPTDAPTPPVAP